MLDIVLGMDWLTTNHAFVDCFSKEVTFRQLRLLEIIFYGEHRIPPLGLIFAITAPVALKKGVKNFWYTSLILEPVR